MKVLFCAAGSGGHIYPALRCAEELQRRRPQSDIRFLSTQRTVEDTIFQTVSFPRLTICFPRAPSRYGTPPLIFCLKIPLFLLQWFAGCMRLARTLRGMRPDIVVGFGGLSAATAVIIARCSGIPTLIHEQNVLPGRANRWAGRWATRVAVAFESGAKYFPRQKTRQCGNPVRRDLERLPAVTARQRLELAEECFTVAVFGGSQGARFLNDRVPAVIAKVLDERRAPLQVVHLSGPAQSETVRRRYAGYGIAARVFEFHRDMGTVYSAADLCICRAGAMTLAELQHYGKAAILVPYPYAASHQLANAQFFGERGAAVLVAEDAQFIDRCSAAVRRLYADSELRRAMAGRCYALRQEEAAEQLVDLLEQTAGA